MFAGMTTHKLVECLEQIPPAELKGLELLRRLRLQTGEWFPAGASSSEVIEATTQLIEYTQVCSTAASRLEKLTPVILTEISVVEFPL
jgi:hypothetical protein